MSINKTTKIVAEKLQVEVGSDQALDAFVQHTCALDETFKLRMVLLISELPQGVETAARKRFAQFLELTK